jgi:hypothetical protein
MKFLEKRISLFKDGGRKKECFRNIKRGSS